METTNEPTTAQVVVSELRTGPRGWWRLWLATLIWLRLAPAAPDPTGWVARDLSAQENWYRRVYWLGVMWTVNLALALALVVAVLL